LQELTGSVAGSLSRFTSLFSSRSDPSPSLSEPERENEEEEEEEAHIEIEEEEEEEKNERELEERNEEGCKTSEKEKEGMETEDTSCDLAFSNQMQSKHTTSCGIENKNEKVKREKEEMCERTEGVNINNEETEGKGYLRGERIVSEGPGNLRDALVGARQDVYTFKHQLAGELTWFAQSLLGRAPADEEPRTFLADASLSEVGVTKELLEYVDQLCTHPETWVEFPSSVAKDAVQLELTQAQQLHRDAVVGSVPQLGQLEQTLCSDQLSPGFFWLVYFVLVNKMLSTHPCSELLFTAELASMRKLLLSDATTPDVESASSSRNSVEVQTSCVSETESEIQTHALVHVVQNAPSDDSQGTVLTAEVVHDLLNKDPVVSTQDVPEDKLEDILSDVAIDFDAQQVISSKVTEARMSEPQDDKFELMKAAHKNHTCETPLDVQALPIVNTQSTCHEIFGLSSIFESTPSDDEWVDALNKKPEPETSDYSIVSEAQYSEDDIDAWVDDMDA